MGRERRRRRGRLLVYKAGKDITGIGIMNITALYSPVVVDWRFLVRVCGWKTGEEEALHFLGI